MVAERCAFNELGLYKAELTKTVRCAGFDHFMSFYSFKVLLWVLKCRVFPFYTVARKLLLTKNYFEIIIFGKITNLTRNSLKMYVFLSWTSRELKSPQKLRKIIFRELFS